LVLTDKKVAEFINQHYINVKINGDSLEGKQLREVYHYPGYPTIILFDSIGNEIDRLIGFDPAHKTEYVQTLKDYTQGRGTLRDYLRRLAIEPDNFDYNYQIAKKYHERGSYQEARPYIQKFIALDKDNRHQKNTEGRYLLAYGQYQLSQNVKPLEDFLKTTAEQDWIRQAYLDIARHYRRQNDTEKVLKTYEAAIQRLPEDARLMNSYAWYIFQNRVESAYMRGIAIASQAVKLAPNDDGIWDTLGQLLFVTGDVQGAIEAMQKASQLNPQNDSYRENLAKYHDALSKK